MQPGRGDGRGDGRTLASGSNRAAPTCTSAPRAHGSRARLTSRVLAAIVAAAVALAGWGPAWAQAPSLENPAARARMERALELYGARSYVAAAAEIEAAYAIEPKPELLYMWAQSKRLGGDCRAAVELYERFLATGPSAEERARAQKNIQRCQAQPQAAPAAPAPGSPPPGGAAPPAAPASPATEAAPAQPAGAGASGPAAAAAPGTPGAVAAGKPGSLARAPSAPGAPPASLAATPGPAPPEARRPRTPWDQNNAGHALVIGAVVSGLAASGLYFWARNEREEAGAARVYQDAAAHAEAATLRRNLAYGAAGLAAALLVTGVVVYVRY